MQLTDTHCHLDFEKFDPDRAAMLDRAEAAGVIRMLVPSIHVASSRGVVALAENDPRLFAAVGIHPTDSLTWDNASATALRELAAASMKVVAIGEIGLDYYWDSAPHDLQQRVLREQLALAAELDLPVVLHFREKGDSPDGPCAANLLAMLTEWTAGLRGGPLEGRTGVLHSFSGSEATARRAIELGFYIGVTGPVTYRKERQQVIAALPPERLLIETDAPFLAPAPHRGKRNEPVYVRLVSDTIAKLHSLPPGQMAEMTTANAGRLFRW